MFRRLFASVLALSLACVAPDGVEVDEIVAPDEGDLGGKADGTSELKVRVAGTSLWLRSSLEVRDDLLVLRGRTSRNLTDTRAFVMDDIYGDAAILSARTFEITWPLSTARGLLDGVDLFVGLGFVHSETRPDNLTARAVVRPRLIGFAGSTQIYLVAALTPIVNAGEVVYRMRGTTQSDAFSFDARIGDERLDTVRMIDARHFEIDVDPATAIEIIGNGTPITVRAHLVGGFEEKTVVLGAALHTAGLTEGDAYEVWPRECTDDTRECLEALDAGSLDLASCGDAFTVNACAGTVGAFVSAEEVAARVAEVDARIDGDFGDDAAALVGMDRVEALSENARVAVTSEIEATRSRWFIDDAARDTALDAETAAAFDRVYAFPLEGFAPRPGVPGDEAATRQLVADALLHYLSHQDYLHSEFSRSYLELVREFRAQHLSSLRAFRETVAREDYPGMPTLDVYVGEWLGTYTEVSVDKTTGVPTHVLVELD
jgi:hypothetical protein